MTETLDPPDKIKDHGWAWVIAAACLVGNFFMMGFTKSFGLFFVEFLELFDASSSATSLIFGTQSIAFSISSLFVMTVLVERVTCRILVIIGSVGFGAGVILASWAVTLTEAVVYIGVFTGVAQSFLTGPFFLMLGKYFTRRYAVACGIAVCGGSLGQFVLPPLLGVFIDIYAFRGALLIFGGLVLNCAVCGALMRPLPGDRQKMKPVKSVKKTNRDQSNAIANSTVVSEKEVLLEAGTTILRNTAAEYAEESGREKIKSVFLKMKNLHTESCQSTPNNEPLDSKTYTSSHYPSWNEEENLQMVPEDPPLRLSTGNLFTPPGSQTIKSAENRVSADSESASGCCCNAIALYCSILKNRLFLLALFSMVFGYVGAVTQVIFTPPHAKDVGLSNDKIALLISIMGGFDLVARIPIGLIADTKVIASYRILAIGFFILGVTAILTSLATRFWIFVAISASYGISGGIMYSLVPVVVLEFFGLETFPRALGMVFLFQGSALCSINPLLGWLRDITGSYVTSFYVIGGCLVSAGISLFLVPFCHHRTDANQESTLVLEEDRVNDDVP